MLNAADIKAKLASPNGRADRLAKEDRPAEARVRELYLAAFSREPRAEELQTALEYLAGPQLDAEGKAIPVGQPSRESFQDLIWALINTKEFLFNH
jgi:hypothetical protein